MESLVAHRGKREPKQRYNVTIRRPLDLELGFVFLACFLPLHFSDCASILAYQGLSLSITYSRKMFLWQHLTSCTGFPDVPNPARLGL